MLHVLFYLNFQPFLSNFLYGDKDIFRLAFMLFRKLSIVVTPPITSQVSCTFIANTTALKGIFQRLATQFGAMYRRKAFLHWYKGEGMDEMEFQEADKNVRDLIT